MMPMFSLSPRSWVKHACASLDSLLHGMSFYIVPVLVVLASVLALFAWAGQYATSGSKTPLAFRVFEQTGNVIGPAQALGQLDRTAGRGELLTPSYPKSPFWFSFTVPADGPRQGSHHRTSAQGDRRCDLLGCGRTWSLWAVQPARLRSAG